jgi:hypothetical protein
MASDRKAGELLLEAGVAAGFRVLSTSVMENPDAAEFGMRVELRLGREEDDDAAEIAEWAALGFIFVFGVMSFADARPRGASEREYRESDEFRMEDFISGLRFVGSSLRFRADYVRGRRVKTDVDVRPDGTVTVQTVGRGQAVLRWLDRLRGKGGWNVVG